MDTVRVPVSLEKQIPMARYPRGRRESTAGSADLAIYVSRLKATGFSLMSLFFVVVSVLAALHPSGMMTLIPAGRILVPLFGLTFLGTGTLRFVTRLLSSAPLLVVSHTGITVNSWLIRDDPIPWSQIEALIARRVQVGTRLEIVCRDPGPIRARQNGLQARLSRLITDPRLPSSVIPIADGILPLSIHELLGQIQARFPHELAQHHVRIRERQ